MRSRAADSIYLFLVCIILFGRSGGSTGIAASFAVQGAGVLFRFAGFRRGFRRISIFEGGRVFRF